MKMNKSIAKNLKDLFELVRTNHIGWNGDDNWFVRNTYKNAVNNSAGNYFTNEYADRLVYWANLMKMIPATIYEFYIDEVRGINNQNKLKIIDYKDWFKGETYDKLEDNYFMQEEVELTDNISNDTDGDEQVVLTALKQMKHIIGDLLDQDINNIQHIIENGHAWIFDHIISAKENLDQVYHYLMDGRGGHEIKDENNDNSDINETLKKWTKISTPSKDTSNNKKYKMYKK